MQLSKALRISNSTVIAFVGAGGKTTAIFRMAQELAPALVTTTTHLGAWQVSMANVHFAWKPDEPMPEMEATFGSGITLVTGSLDEAIRRTREYVYPHEDKRMRDSSGGKMGSMVGKLLIFEREAPFLNRKISLLFVRQIVGD